MPWGVSLSLGGEGMGRFRGSLVGDDGSFSRVSYSFGSAGKIDGAGLKSPG